jgi:hypothetical protein
MDDLKSKKDKKNSLYNKNKVIRKNEKLQLT